MTPQPQPAAYWIELLEELTGGIPEFERMPKKGVHDSLSSFINSFSWYESEIDADYWGSLYVTACKIECGQNVIDAAVEFATSIPSFEKRMNLVEQTSLYLRCNGIKR